MDFAEPAVRSSLLGTAARFLGHGKGFAVVAERVRRRASGRRQRAEAVEDAGLHAAVAAFADQAQRLFEVLGRFGVPSLREPDVAEVLQRDAAVGRASRLLRDFQRPLEVRRGFRVPAARVLDVAEDAQRVALAHPDAHGAEVFQSFLQRTDRFVVAAQRRQRVAPC